MATILILTQVYVPDTPAVGQYLHDSAVTLISRGHDVCVLTASRGYENPTRKYSLREIRDEVEIRRIPLTSFGKNSILARLLGGLSLVIQTILRGILSQKFDAILVSTSPPMCSIAALVLSCLRKTPICYWVMDLNPDQIIKLGMLEEGSFPARLMNWLNRRILGRAERIVVLDRHMAGRVQCKRDVASKTAIIPPWPHNSPAEKFEHTANPWRKEQLIGDDCLVMMYSGNHSLANPLDTFLQAALLLQDEDGLCFFFVGGGLGKQEVEAIIERESPRNLRSLPYQPLETLRYSLSAADVHLVSVGNETVGISHSCKIYGAMAAGRPILLLSPKSCYATEIIERHDVGWHVTHGDVGGTVEVLRQIRHTPPDHLVEMGRNAQELVQRHYSRDVLRSRFCDEVEAVLRSSDPTNGMNKLWNAP